LATPASFPAADAEKDDVDVVAFGQSLAGLSVEDIRSIAADLADACASPADEVASTRATLVIEQTLRRTHRLQDAAAAALVVATSVQDVAHRAHVNLPDDDVTRVARAAAQLARGLVAGDGPGMEDALHCLVRGWHRLACCAELAA
jgi:hypothetical protein